MFLYEDSFPVPATIGAVTRIITNRELYVFLSTRELYHVAMKSATKRNRRKSQREAARQKRQTVPEPSMDEEEELEVHFGQPIIGPDSPQASPQPDPEDSIQGEADYATVLVFVNNLRDKLAALNLDNDNIRAACDALRRQCHSQGVAFGNLPQLVRQSLEGRQVQPTQEEPRRPHPIIRPELIDGGGNLRAEDTFLYGVQVAGRRDDRGNNRHRPVTSAPYPPGREEMEDIHQQPVLSPPYPPGREHPLCDMSTPRFPRPVCIEMSDTPAHHFAGPRQEGRPAHRPAAPIQRFNNKTIGWPAWFRHFKAVADVHGWEKNQRALQMVSYLDEKAMNVAQELTDRELYDYDVLVKLLSDRFNPASRVSASRSRFHGRTRRHQEDADTYADTITELCRLGYPLRQELISEQFVRGQSDPELKKYLWVVIRTLQTLIDKKLQTLIEVCTDFASLSHTTNVHRPAERCSR